MANRLGNFGFLPQLAFFLKANIINTGMREEERYERVDFLCIHVFMCNWKVTLRNFFLYMHGIDLEAFT